MNEELLLAVTPMLTAVLGVYPDCPGASCTGTAWDRHYAAREAARGVDLNRPWPEVRKALVSACGLQVQESTSHCFNDFNHVDCCTMQSEQTQKTNEESKVVGMHSVNFLGDHIVDASLKSHGDGGSWCTCHLSAPHDVCHKQFGARPAFKLVFCHGGGQAALMDDDGNILASGKPLPDGGTVPEYGGERARKQLWGVLVKSKNETMTSRWLRSCDAATAFAEDGTLDHDEL